MLRMYLFGAPRLERDGEAVALRRTKALALLAYLAMSGQPQERDTLRTERQQIAWNPRSPSFRRPLDRLPARR